MTILLSKLYLLLVAHNLVTALLNYHQAVANPYQNVVFLFRSMTVCCHSFLTANIFIINLNSIFTTKKILYTVALFQINRPA